MKPIIHFFESKRERVKNKIKYHIDGICHTTETEHGDKDKAEALGQSLTTE